MGMLRRLVTSAGILCAAVLVAPTAAAAPLPGDSCSPNGSTTTADGGTKMTCNMGKWTLEGPPPNPGDPAAPEAPDQPSTSSSSVKPAKNFRTVGTALTDATFGNDSGQVADATGIRLPNGRIRLFAFVNSTIEVPGTLSATATSKKGTSFAADATPPMPGVAAGQPRVVSLGGNKMRLFYVAAGSVNAAISTDGGLTFTQEGPVITTEQAGFEPGGITVIRHKGKWRAYFSNLEKPGERAPRVMRTATSSDMLNWTMGPIITQKSGPLKDGGSHPFAVVDKGRIALYYAGDRGSFYGILVSTSNNGINFTGEKSVIAGGGDPDIVRVGKNKWLMYYGANLGGDEFGIKVARSTGKGKVVPR